MRLKRLLSGFFLSLFLVACDTEAPIVDYSDQEAVASSYKFDSVRSSVDSDGITRELMQYQVDGLIQYALVLWPVGQAPQAGWPVLVFNHGFHPDPSNHGRIDGQDARPGAYYWGLPQLYALNGYAVIAPDYRGHNISEGAEYTEMNNAAHWYTRDAIAAFYAARELTDVDLERFYMSGHSMGGAITQRAMQVLGGKLKAAAVWSTSYEDLWELEYVRQLEVPVIVHHGREDQSTDVQNTLSYVEQLELQERPHQAFIYNTDNHLFGEDFFELAINRDISWFQQNR